MAEFLKKLIRHTRLSGFISKQNRTSQSIFCCKKCGNKANADINAAKNILEYKQWFS